MDPGPFLAFSCLASNITQTDIDLTRVGQCDNQIDNYGENRTETVQVIQKVELMCKQIDNLAKTSRYPL